MRKYVWICILATLLIFTACKKEDKIVSNETVSEAQTKETETEAETEPKYSEFKGIKLYEAGQNTNNSGRISMVAEITKDEPAKEGFVQNVSLLGINDGNLVMGYSVAFRDSDEGDSEGWSDDTKFEHHLALVDSETFVIYEDIIVTTNGSASFMKGNDSIWCVFSDEKNFKAIGYDMQLERLGMLKIPETEVGSFSANQPVYYYLKDGKMHCRTLDGGGIDEVIEPSQPFFIDQKGYTYVGADSYEYVMVSGYGRDLKKYSGMMNLSTGELLNLSGDGDGLPIGYNDDGCFVSTGYYEDGEKMTVDRYASNPISFTIEENHFFSQFDVIDNCIVVSYIDGVFSNFGLFSRDTGNWICSDQMYSESNQSFSYYAGFSSSYLFTDEDEITFASMDYEGNVGFFKWDISENSHENMDVITVTQEDEYETSVVVVEGEWDPNYFAPTELSEEFMPLRERADELERKYGVTISLGTECKKIVGGYAIMAIEDFTTLSDALTYLELEMDKYPKNFFPQLKTQSTKEINICIAGEMYGIDSGSLEAAGGLKTYEGSTMLVMVDCTYPDNINLTLHHELSHAIDDKISDKEFDEDSVILDDEYWDSLNPDFEGHESIYTYSYGEFGWENSFYYTSDDHLFDEDMSMVYFIDSYSMTFPTEDRARIFENIMRDDCWIEWEKCTGLNAKKNYYIECIKKAFDTTGWSEDFLETEK